MAGYAPFALGRRRRAGGTVTPYRQRARARVNRRPAMLTRFTRQYPIIRGAYRPRRAATRTRNPFRRRR